MFPHPESARAAELRLQDVTRRFGEQVALDRVSLHVPAGDCCGFLGHNGSGKTTAMQVALGLPRPRSGMVLVDGFDAAARPSEARTRMAVSSRGRAFTITCPAPGTSRCSRDSRASAAHDTPQPGPNGSARRVLRLKSGQPGLLDYVVDEVVARRRRPRQGPHETAVLDQHLHIWKVG